MSHNHPYSSKKDPIKMNFQKNIDQNTDPNHGHRNNKNAGDQKVRFFNYF